MAKRILVALVATIAAFAANTGVVNAQSYDEQVANRLAQKGTFYLKGAEQPTRSVVDAAAQHTQFYDNRELEVEKPLGKDTVLVMDFNSDIMRSATSGIRIGVQTGAQYMDGKISPSIGIIGTYAWKRVETSLGGSASFNYQNEYSTEPGKKSYTFLAEWNLGYVLRGSLRGRSNQWYFAIGPTMGYRLDQTRNKMVDLDYTVDGVDIHEERFTSVKGNSMYYGGYAKASFSTNFMGRTVISLKGFIGVCGRYYPNWMEKKLMANVMLSFEFTGAKKYTDPDVVYLQKRLEQGGGLELIDMICAARK